MADAQEGPAEAEYMLVILTGDFEGTRHILKSDETIIGRNPTTDITLLDEGISREHAIVSRDETTGSYAVEDLQSTNGTKVNGKRVRNSPLNPGDEIEVGHTKFKFTLNDGSE